MKQIIYREHAVQRMSESKISPAEVSRVLHDADGIIKQTKDKCIFYKKMTNRKDNLIAIVALNYPERYEVITVMINFEVKNENNS